MIKNEELKEPIVNYNNISVEPAGLSYTLLVKGQDVKAQAMAELGVRLNVSRRVSRNEDVNFTDAVDKISSLIDGAFERKLLGTATHSHLKASLGSAEGQRGR